MMADEDATTISRVEAEEEEEEGTAPEELEEEEEGGGNPYVHSAAARNVTPPISTADPTEGEDVPQGDMAPPRDASQWQQYYRGQQPSLCWGMWMPCAPPSGPFFWPFMPPGYTLVPSNMIQQCTKQGMKWPPVEKKKEDPTPLPEVKRRRTVTISKFSEEQTARLLESFSTQPRPSSGTVGTLAEELALTARQVKIWFQNHRSRARRMAAAEAAAAAAAAVASDQPKQHLSPSSIGGESGPASPEDSNEGMGTHSGTRSKRSA